MRPRLKPVQAAYWTVRHALWRAREVLFVREVKHRLKRSQSLFVHEYEGEGARWTVRWLAAPSHLIGEHSHVEGRKRK